MADGSAPAALEQPVDVKWIAHALRRDWSVVAKRARKESWPFYEEPVRGGRRRMYQLASLPADVQSAVRHANAVAATQALQSSPDFQAGQAVGRRLAIAEAVDQEALERHARQGA